MIFVTFCVFPQIGNRCPRGDLSQLLLQRQCALVAHDFKMGFGGVEDRQTCVSTQGVSEGCGWTVCGMLCVCVGCVCVCVCVRVCVCVCV